MYREWLIIGNQLAVDHFHHLTGHEDPQLVSDYHVASGTTHKIIIMGSTNFD